MQEKSGQIENDSSWTYQKVKVVGQSDTVKSKETSKSRVTIKILLPGAEATGAINCLEQLNGNLING